MKYNIVIGYDRNNRMPAYTLAESIMQTTSVRVNFTFLHRDMLKEYTRPQAAVDSTEFSNSRFLTPYLNDYTGWSLYLDNDMILLSDVKELFDLADERFAVMCVKHNQLIEKDNKFLGKQQFKYPYKNWSSLMLFNNSQCKQLTIEYVNTARGLDMHQFKWLSSHDLIGTIPLEWNYLVDNKNQTNKDPKLLHYTNGGPYFLENRNCSYSDNWTTIYNQINDVRK